MIDASNMVPEGWNSPQLGKLFKILKGSIVPKDDPTEQLEYYSIPVFDQTGSSTVVYGSEIESNKTLISEPAILVSKLNPRKPRVQVVKQSGEHRQCASTEFMAYSPKHQDINLTFYKYYFLSDYFSNRLQLVATGSTNSHVRVTPSETLKWSVPAPPLPEQQKIATILSSVDDVIEKTRAQIDKLKDLKTGMMQELLTKGIGHTEFKDSPVGRIPALWNVVEVRDIQSKEKYSCVGGPFGSDLTSKHYVDTVGVPVIRGSNLPLDFRRFIDQGFVYVTEEKADSLSKNMAYPGDLIFTQRGTLGQVGLIPDDARFNRYVISQSQMKLTVDEDIADKEFLYQFFLSPTFLRALVQETIATGLPHINLGILKSFFIPLPPKNEQKEIGRTLYAIDQKAGILYAKLNAQIRLKKALMQDLLTGKVRVNVGQDISVVA